MVTPSNLALVTNSRGLPFRTGVQNRGCCWRIQFEVLCTWPHSVETHRDSLVSKGHPELLGVCSHYPLQLFRSHFVIGELTVSPMTPSLGYTNKHFVIRPLSNFDLMDWVKKLNIKHLRGVFSRDMGSRVKSEKNVE